jgi:hypothetical protein
VVLTPRSLIKGMGRSSLCAEREPQPSEPFGADRMGVDEGDIPTVVGVQKRLSVDVTLLLRQKTKGNCESELDRNRRVHDEGSLGEIWRPRSCHRQRKSHEADQSRRRFIVCGLPRACLLGPKLVASLHGRGGARG